MDNQNCQDMIEHEGIQLLIEPIEEQIRMHFSFNPFLNYHFVEKIKKEKGLEIKVISYPGTIICLRNEEFDYRVFFGDINQYITGNYEKFVLLN